MRKGRAKSRRLDDGGNSGRGGSGPAAGIERPRAVIRPGRLRPSSTPYAGCSGAGVPGSGHAVVTQSRRPHERGTRTGCRQGPLSTAGHLIAIPARFLFVVAMVVGLHRARMNS